MHGGFPRNVGAVFRSASCFAAAGSPPALGGRMCLACLRLPTTLCLSLGGLPTTHQQLAPSTLAIPLIPASGLETVPTSFAQTDAAAKSTAASRTVLVASILKMSQGRSCSRRGRPSDSPKSLGHYSFLDHVQRVRAGTSSEPSCIPLLGLGAHKHSRDLHLNPNTITGNAVVTHKNHSLLRRRPGRRPIR